MNDKKMVPISVFFLILVLFSLPAVQAVEPIWTYSSPGSEITGVTVSSDGSVIAVGAGNIWLLSRSGELLARESYGEQVVFTPDGSSLVSSYLFTFYLFRRNVSQAAPLSPFNKIWEISTINSVQSVDISDDGKTVVISVSGKGTYIYSSSGKFTGGDDHFNSIVRVSAKGEQIAGVSQDGLCLYISKTKRGKCSLSENVTVISEPDFMEITTNGDSVVFNDAQKIITVSTRNQDVRWSRMATGDVTALTMTPMGTRILVGTDRGNINLFDNNGNLSWSYATNPAGTPLGAGVTGVALSNDGNIAVAGTYEGKVIAMNTDGKELWSNQTKDHIRHVAMSGDGSLVIATGDETVYAFSQSARPILTVRSPEPTTIPAQQQNVTTIPGTIATQKPIVSESAPKVVTSVPTPYSVIRTATQSPVSDIIPFLGFLVALLVLVRRR